MTTAPATQSDRLLKPFVIAAGGTLLITIIAITGSASLLVLDRLIRDGPFLLWWMIAAGGYGHWPTVWLAPRESPRSLQKVTGVGIGFGVISLLTLGLGACGLLNTVTAYGVLTLGTLIFPWHELAKTFRSTGTVLPSPLVPKGRGTEGEGLALATPAGSPDASGPRRTPLPLSLSPGYREEGGKLSPLIFAWLPLIVLAGIMIVAACVPPGLLWTDEPHGYDVVEYHLQVPREWYEAGRISPLEHNVFSHLPMNVEMHYLLAMHLKGGPWAGMYLAQMMNGVFVLVMIVTLLVGVGWPAAMIAAAVPWMTMLASICYVEAGQLMWATLAVVWMVPTYKAQAFTALFPVLRGEGQRERASSKTDGVLGPEAVARAALSPTLSPGTGRGKAVLAGVCAGFACGAKLTSVPMLVFALPVAVVLARLVPSPRCTGERVRVRGSTTSLAQSSSEIDAPDPLAPALSPAYGREGGRHSLIRTVLPLFAFGLVALLVFSPWLIRTFAATHNLIFPEAMHLFGRGPFTEIQQERWEQSLRPAAQFWSLTGHATAFWQQILADWRWGYLIIPAAVAAFVLRRRNCTLPLAMGLCLAFWLCFTHLQGRFGLLMIPLAAVAIGQVDSIVWRRIIAAVACLMCIASAVPLLQRLTPFVEVIGAEAKDLKVLLPPQAVDAMEAEKSIALIGDAKAFWYQTPMTRLHYRTVFDVKATPDQSAADHWLDPADTSGAVKVIDESELQRFARTYYGLPQTP